MQINSYRAGIGSIVSPPPASGFWTPANIVTQAWFDADDAGTITIATGVSQWDDKSGNGRHVSQGTAANQPAYNSTQLNSKPVLTFDGSNDVLQRTGGVTGLMQAIGQAAVYIVYRQTSTPIAGSSDCIYTVTDNAGTSYRAISYQTGSPPETGGNGLRVVGARVDGAATSNVLTLYPIPAFNLWHIKSDLFDYSNSDLLPFQNGSALTGSASFSTDGAISDTAAANLGIGCDNAGGQPITGDIAEIIITHNTRTRQRLLIEGYLAHKWGLTANLPTSHPFKAHQPTEGDPDAACIVSLLHFDGADTATATGDVAGFTWTFAGDAQLDTAQSKFGGSSLLLDGTGDYISTPDSAAHELSNGQDCSFEAWVRPNATKLQAIICKKSATPAGYFFGTDSSNRLNFIGYTAAGATAINVLSTTVLSTGQWYHVAVCREGTTWRLFVDGVLEDTDTQSGTIAGNTNALFVGRDEQDTARDFNGHIDDVRILKGTARYTATFTPPTTSHPDATDYGTDANFANVSALLVFDGIDGEINPLDVVGNYWARTGSSSITDTRSRSGATAWHNPLSANGSSRLDSASLAKYGYGTGDFTIEFYIWIHSLSGNTSNLYAIYDQRTAGTDIAPMLYINGTSLRYAVGNTDRITGATAMTTGAWHHIAVSRVSGTTRLFLNGVQEGSSYTDSNNYITSRVRLGNFGDNPSYAIQAFWDEVRLTKGVGRYSSGFTPPTAPFARR